MLQTVYLPSQKKTPSSDPLFHSPLSFNLSCHLCVSLWHLHSSDACQQASSHLTKLPACLEQTRPDRTPPDFVAAVREIRRVDGCCRLDLATLTVVEACFAELNNVCLAMNTTAPTRLGKTSTRSRSGRSKIVSMSHTPLNIYIKYPKGFGHPITDNNNTLYGDKLRGCGTLRVPCVQKEGYELSTPGYSLTRSLRTKNSQRNNLEQNTFKPPGGAPKETK